MSMKHKLRRAFRRTAPNVLGSILQDLPELQKTTQPAPVEKKWLPHWFTELAATAAALALLLGVISGAIWFARNSEIPDDPHVTPSDPSSLIGSDWDHKGARNSVLQHLGIDMSDIQYLNVTFLSREAYDCSVTVKYSSSQTIFYVDGPCAVVDSQSVTIESSPDVALAYVIPWRVARDIALEQADLTLDDLIGFEYEFDDETGIPIYTVRLLDANSAEPHTVRINGYTGEITGPVLSRLKARDAALAYLGLDLNDVRSLDVGYSYHDTYAFYVSISTMEASHRLQISSSYAISSCESKTYDTDNHDGPKLDWRQARDAALEHRGFSLDELVSLAVYNKHDHYRVRIMTQHSVDEIFVSVDATTGAIIDQDETLLSEAEAQALAQKRVEELSTVDQTELVTAEDGQRYYWISLRGQIDDWHLCYYVHAVTGKVTIAPLDVIVPPSPSDRKLDEKSAIHIVLEKQYGINWRNRVSLVTCVYDDSVSDDCHYVINFEHDGQFHSVSIHAYSWEILSHTQIPLDHDSTQEHFQTLFGTPGSYYNSALTSLYTSPTELDLYRFFYHTYALDCVVPAINFTQEIPVLDRLKQILLLPDHTIDRVLTNHFGIAMQDLSPEALENLGYISLIDFYYVASEGTVVTENFQIMRMETAEDGTVQLYYTCSNYAYTCVVTLKPTDSGYIILSNLPA